MAGRDAVVLDEDLVPLAAGTGVVGRNYAYQITSSVGDFLDEILNPFMGAGALGQATHDFNGNYFDNPPH